MRSAKVFALLLVLITVSVPIAAGDCDVMPVKGTYSTYAGTQLPGRASEAFCLYPFNGGVPGNTESAASWDGAVLGGQWTASGMYIDENGAVETDRSIDAYGNGYIDYSTNYLGGTFWLTGAHIWSSDGNPLTGYLTYFNVGTRLTVIGGQVVGLTSNVTFRGTFDQCSVCYIRYAITNAMRVGVITNGAPPAGFPAFECGATSGEIFDLCCILTDIWCDEIGADESTWGGIKAMYR